MLAVLDDPVPLLLKLLVTLSHRLVIN